MFKPLVCLALLASLWMPARGETCDPPASGVAQLIEVAPRFFSVIGSLATFDPCHRSVDFNRPWGVDKPPLMIISHGGSGLGPSERNLATALRRLGIATLVYDAYEMNGLYRPWQFWASNVTNEARQRMNYKVTLGAYEWALRQEKIDTRRIYFHGVSNGAATVVNIAAAVDPAHVKGAFAEGLPGAGLGLPDDLRVPVRLVHGRLDNYAGRTVDEWRWLIQESCANNGLPERFIQPPGNAARCNFRVNPRALTPTPLAWYEEQKAKGADIDIWWYDGAAHGMFLGPVSRDMRAWGANEPRYAWTGGDQASRDKFLSDFKGFVAR